MRGADEDFGAMLRRLRERAGLTQEQLAERAGISANAVSSLERGVRRRPYRHTRDALAAALGITAGERAAWHGRIAPGGPRPRLPAVTSTILGRASAIEDVTRLLADNRIVTLVGPGGVGKSRLALAVAERAGDHYPGGVAFVPLAALRDAEAVLPAVAHALGLRELGPRTVSEALAAHLRGRAPLLVLDNLEHLPDAAPELAALVGSAAGFRVLVTSRAPLRVRGEHVHPVPALSPEVSARLFVERSRQAGGPAIEAGAPAVAELCARLDHLPLAIELAAAQTRLLTPAQQLDRYDAVLRGSAGAPRDAPPRHQTLHDTVRWSYELLGEGERLLLRQAAVFAGGWTLRAATQLTGLSEADALDRHLALLDHSLIVRDASAAEPRFGLLETVRAFALGQLASAGELAPAGQRHATLFGALAASAHERLWGPEAPDALDGLEADLDNVRAALRHLLDSGRTDELAAACFGSWLFWVVRGHLRDAHTIAVAALAGGGELAAGTRARLHIVAGCTALPRGGYDEAEGHFARAARLADDDVTRCWALGWGAQAEVYRGRPEAAEALLAAAEHAAADAAAAAEDATAAPGAEHAETGLVIGRAHVAIANGAMRRADTLLTEHLPRIEARGAPWLTGVALGIQGRIASVLGDPARADALLRRSVEIFGELGDTWGMAHQLTHVADVAVQRGDHTRAALLYGAIDTLAEQVGARVFPTWQDLSDRCQATALAALGVDRYTTLRRRGRELTPEAVVELAAGGS